MTTNDTLRVTDSRTGRSYELPIVDGAIRAIDLRQIKTSDDDFGLLSYDPAFQNTASCRSAITFIDGDKGILRYRGYPIEELASRASFLDVAWLLLRGEMPNKEESAGWAHKISHHTYVHENVKKFIDGFHHDAHPMGILVSTLAALSTFYPEAKRSPRPGQPGRAGGAADRQDADAGGVRLPARPGAALRVPRRRPVLRGQLPQHDVEDDRAQVRPGPGARARPGRAVHPARRPRAELLHQRDAQRVQLPGRPVLGGRRGRGGALRPAARRRERAGAEDAAGDRLGRATSPPTSTGSRAANCA